MFLVLSLIICFIFSSTAQNNSILKDDGNATTPIPVGSTNSIIIEQNGNIGIGASSIFPPLEKLDVRGNMKLNGGMKFPSIYYGAENGNIGWLTSDYGNGFGHKFYQADAGNGTTELRLVSRHNTSSWSDVFRVNLQGVLRFMNHIKILPYTGSTYTPAIEWQPSDWGNGFGHTLVGIDAGNGTTELQFLSRHNTSSWTKNLTLTSQGKVYIGTTKPSGSFIDYKLAVDGKLVAKEIVVQTSQWADKVFDKDYKLTALTDLEQYIKENKHLPEIPTEAQVLENGINLNEMNVKLLQKVEELTLYNIEMNKKLQMLEAKLNKRRAK